MCRDKVEHPSRRQTMTEALSVAIAFEAFGEEGHLQ
jgi:preprotein translocase subunit SecE